MISNRWLECSWFVSSLPLLWLDFWIMEIPGLLLLVGSNSSSHKLSKEKLYNISRAV